MFAFLSMIRGSVQSPLCVFFRYALYSTWLQSSLEMFSSIWQQSEDEHSVAGVGGLQHGLPDPCEIPTLQGTASASGTYGIGA